MSNNNSRFAFTMIELVFVIVVLGILAAIAIPRLAATRDDAEITKGRSDVSAIRSAIVSERQGRLLKGDSAYISKLDQRGATSADGEMLFDDNDTNTTNGALLQYGIASGTRNGHWRKTADNTYQYKVLNADTQFTYSSNTGRFDCDHANSNCKLLVD